MINLSHEFTNFFLSRNGNNKFFLYHRAITSNSFTQRLWNLHNINNREGSVIGSRIINLQQILYI